MAYATNPRPFILAEGHGTLGRIDVQDHRAGRTAIKPCAVPQHSKD